VADDEAAQLPVTIGELCSALERMVGPDELTRPVDRWID
jgi:hypothetical protein